MKYGFIALALVLSGCASDYVWKSTVPDEYRTITVPVFRNESFLTGFGASVSSQIAREIQREGTFVLSGSAVIEVQGEVESVTTSSRDIFRTAGRRHGEYIVNAVVSISFVNKKTGEVLVEGRKYKARTTVLAGQDTVTAERNASGRLAAQIARDVVDDLVGFNWKKESSK